MEIQNGGMVSYHIDVKVPLLIFVSAEVLCELVVYRRVFGCFGSAFIPRSHIQSVVTAQAMRILHKSILDLVEPKWS